MNKVLVAGSYIYDVAVYVKDAPIAGQTVLGEECKMSSGGKGSNQAVAAAKAGADVFMITKVGNDAFGRTVFDLYDQYHMSTKYVFQTDRASTGCASIVVDSHGQNRIVVVLGANNLLSAKDIQKAKEDIADCDVLLTQFESSNESICEFIRLGREYNKTVILNPAPINDSISKDIYKNVDYITPNETEAAQLANMSSITSLDDAKEAAKRILELGVKNVIITLGSLGSYFYNGNEEYHVLPLSVDVVDTTGAGDAYNGGFAWAKSNYMDDLEAMRYATCVAGLSVTRRGAALSMPDAKDVQDLYNKVFKKEKD